MYPNGQDILLIDNDVGRRQLCEQILEGEGFAVTSAAEGVSAIRAGKNAWFALAIAAMDLPGTLDGPTTIRQIRVRQPGLKVLFTGDVARRPPLRRRDRDDFIPSPFHRRDLLGCVFEMLHREIAPARDAGPALRAESRRAG